MQTKDQGNACSDPELLTNNSFKWSFCISPN